MDTRTPLVPDLDGFRAKVLRQTPSPFPDYFCCICHQRPAGNPERICGSAKCWNEARALGWLES